MIINRDTSIQMVAQPIIDLTTGETVMKEWLCRPLDRRVIEYFDVEDPASLWRREAACIQEAMKCPSVFPKLLNLTLSSLPYFLETNWTWEGGIEIVGMGTQTVVHH